MSTVAQRSHRHGIGSSGLAHPTLVAPAFATSSGLPSDSAAIPQIVPPLGSITAASATKQNEAYYSQGLQNMAEGFNLSEKAKTFISKSHRPATRKAYGHFLKLWQEFCHRRHADPNIPTVALLADFVLEHFKDEQGQQRLQTKLGISLAHYFPHFQHVFKHPVLDNLSRSLFQVRLTNAHIKNYVWDANIVLDALCEYPPYSELPIAWHSVKLALLILLSTMSRKQVLEMLDINHMTFRDDSVEFVLQGRQKQFRAINVDHDHTVLELIPFPVDDKICLVKCLIEYLNATKYVQPPDQAGLFLWAIPPFTNVKTGTFAGWVKKGLLFSGIDLNQFKLHSTRAASSSTAFQAGIPVNEVLLWAEWSSLSTFMRFYGRSVHSVPGVSLVHLCFFGTNKGKTFLAQHHE